MDKDLDFGIGTADFNAENDLQTGGTTDIIHLRVQQRVGRKMITLIEGIPEEFDYKKILKAWKKVFFPINFCVYYEFIY